MIDDTMNRINQSDDVVVAMMEKIHVERCRIQKDIGLRAPEDDVILSLGSNFGALPVINVSVPRLLNLSMPPSSS
jgi:hypothetical protein